MKNVAIIGCGYVGSEVAHHWKRQGFTVTVTTTNSDRISELEAIADRVIVVKGDNQKELKTVLQGQEVVLLSIGAKTRKEDIYRNTYLATAQTLVDLLPEFPTVQQIIYTGVYSLYGDRDGDRVDESFPVSPTSIQSQILWETENVLLSAARETRKICILRLGGIYGRDREIAKIFKRIAGQTLAGKGENISNWVHLEDIVKAIDFAREKQLGGIYNLVCDEQISRRELLDRVCQIHNLPAIAWDEKEIPYPYNVRVSTEKIKEAGFQFLYPQLAI
ncbi:SDR family oxidoreductase [Spirulina sp. 06S082]|uniref:SDR family oxidoreductase n=1 Tax=Spirulina sp. 06S082 TaxID=3110248 RepID=UPI002B2149C5|nr:SDR family oxidoreductase [Spirulina sp. 06S082]MEA5471390.1 SDR family oxidoreductase [Spirulina sp. 06S082]